MTLDLDTLVLGTGSHVGPEAGMCVLEAVSMLAGEAWSDAPVCVSPAIGAFLRAWNDGLPDEDRQMLVPLIPAVMGTNTGAADDDRRAWLATDWLVRTNAPAWLDLAGLTDHAAELRALPELTSAGVVAAAIPVLRQAKRAWAAEAASAAAAGLAAAWAAAGTADAASDAASAAASDAAWAAAWTAAGAAAGTAAAASDAAWDAAGDALTETVHELQVSALDLVRRMAAVGRLS